MAPNKTLAAQLANEFRELLPNNAVEYFVSYYDYYQPEAYIAQTDTYIEKDSSVNDEVERLRHSATNSLLTRRDVIVVASVSCIYGLGTPQEYVDRMASSASATSSSATSCCASSSPCSTPATTWPSPAARSGCGATPSRSSRCTRSSRCGSSSSATRSRRSTRCTRSPARWSDEQEIYVFPATHYVAGPERMERAIAGIEHELGDRLHELEQQGKLLEAQRLRMRTTYDIEMMRQVGFCSGIENYSRHIDGRDPGTAPHTLLDYFPDDFLLVIDESHVTVPQIGAMFEGDMSRKRTLVDHGFRLPERHGQPPAAVGGVPRSHRADGLPVGHARRLRAGQGDGVVEQIIRPTGLIDPEVVVKPTKGQIDDLMGEIRARAERDERVLVTTLTKKMAEDLTDYLLEQGVRVRYLHSEVDTLRRVELLRELRLGEYDVLVGINLLREGLDLPEVSLVAILDADKEGFLRSGTSLIQTIGRAARNVSGQVHMYADKITPSMALAIDETNRRRAKQVAYNTANGVDPMPLRKKIADITDLIAREDADTAQLLGGGAGSSPAARPRCRDGLSARRQLAAEPPAAAGRDLADLIQQLTDQMHAAAASSSSSWRPGCATRSVT